MNSYIRKSNNDNTFYYHIDNGGYTFEYNPKDHFLKVSTNFFGYSSTELTLPMLSAEATQELGLWLLEVSRKMEFDVE